MYSWQLCSPRLHSFSLGLMKKHFQGKNRRSYPLRFFYSLMSVQLQQQTITIAISIMIQQFWLPKKESKHPIVNPPFLLPYYAARRFVLKICAVPSKSHGGGLTNKCSMCYNAFHRTFVWGELHLENRVILHSDANSFFASVAAAEEPSLKGKAVAVCGSVEERHGIVLAKSEKAKRYGIYTGQTVGDAKRACPELCIVPPNYGLYADYSERLKRIYARFSDRIEPFGLDECWLDVSSAIKKFDDGRLAADMIREQVKEELDITVSVGVSFNKVFAKLGSDLKKPNGTTVITPEGFRVRLKGLPVESLLGVGRSTKRALNRYGIFTLGQLADCERGFLVKALGKAGSTLWRYANGLDDAPVVTAAEAPPVKSVGHGTTPPRDLTSEEEVFRLMLALCQDVGTRLRQFHMRCRGVCVSVRDTALCVRSMQAATERATDNSGDIARAAFGLFRAQGGLSSPLRSLSVTAIRLESSDAPLQTDLLSDPLRLEKRERLDKAVDAIRKKYGKAAVLPASICKREFVFSDSGISLPLTRT